MQLNHVAVIGLVNNRQRVKPLEARVMGFVFDLIIPLDPDSREPRPIITVEVRPSVLAHDLANTLKDAVQVQVVGRLGGSQDDGPIIVAQQVTSTYHFDDREGV